MQSIGIYDVAINGDEFYIFPESKEGETLCITIDRTYFHLRHAKSLDVVTFKRFRHQGKWKWNDSRVKGSVNEQQIVSEVARMLFSRDEGKAKDFLIAGIMGKGK